MSQTLEIRQIVNSGIPLFDFDYELYDNDLKPKFEKDFIENFWYENIGHESLGRFKRGLQIKLNMINDYYKDYYKTVIELQTRDMMETKSVKETFYREINGIGESESKATDKSNVKSSNKNINKFSNLPTQLITDLDNHLTNATVDTGDTNGNTESENSSKTTSSNKGTERTEFTSVGNLGVSSDGFLIEKWRELIVSINQKILNEELRELFFAFY